MNTLFIGVRKNEEEITSGPQKISNYLYNRLANKYSGFYYYGIYEDEVPENPSEIDIINDHEVKGPLKKLRSFIKDKKIGVIYFGRYHSLWALYLTFLKSLEGFKLVYTVHGIVKKESQINNSFKFYHVLCEKILLKKCDKIIVISHDLRDELLKYYPMLDNKKITVINNGVEINSIKQKIEIRNIYKLDDAKKIIFTVGLRKIKNIEKLIEEYVKSNLLYNSTYLLIAGESDTDYSREIISKYKEYHNIRFIGLVDPDHLNNIYDQCDMYIQISEFETFGMSIVESLLHKRNVLMSSHLPIAKYFNDEEVCFYDKDRDDLENKMIQCLGRDRYNVKGYEKVSELFNWSKISEEYYMIFKETFEQKTIK